MKAQSQAIIDMNLEGLKPTEDILFEARLTKAIHAGCRINTTFDIPSGSHLYTLDDSRHFGFSRS